MRRLLFWVSILTLLVSLVPWGVSQAVAADTGFRFPMDSPFTSILGLAASHECGPYHNGVDYHVGYRAPGRCTPFFGHV